VNWSYLKPILVKLTETEDFNYVLEQRYLNFKNYRINAMDSAEGNILVDGNDMSAIIGRNLSTIRQIVKDTQMPEETAEKFFEVWNTFEPTSNFLNR
jgi:hypothetical protein